MKSVFNSEFHLGESNEIIWKFSYDCESGAWTVFPVDDVGSYGGVSHDILEARESAKLVATRSLVRPFDSNELG